MENKTFFNRLKPFGLIILIPLRQNRKYTESLWIMLRVWGWGWGSQSWSFSWFFSHLEEEGKAHFADENGRNSIAFFIRPNIVRRNFSFSQSNCFSLVSSAVQLIHIDTIQMKFSIVQGLSPHLARNLLELRLNTLNFSSRISLIG